MYYLNIYDSPLGPLLLYSDGKSLTDLWLEKRPHFPEEIRNRPVQQQDLPIFHDVRNWLDCYFSGDRPTPDELPLKPEGTDFQLAVWHRLCQIPYGETTTYGTLARQFSPPGGRMSPQAIGGAVGRNPISIIIPCHRVVGADGSLVGYGGGVNNKRWLLLHEGIAQPALIS